MQLLVTTEALQEPEVHWLPWIVILLTGFLTGATLDLFSLWLFAHCMHG